MRSYLGLSLGLSFCLMFVVACSDDNGTGGTGGTPGAGGAGGAGATGGGGGSGGADTAVTKTISLGCTNSVSADVSILDWDLSIDPGGPVGPSEEFTAEVDGVAFFSEGFLDAALAIVPGLNRAALVDIAATVIPRSGATGDAVVLKAEPIDPFTCSIDPLETCDPANDTGDGGNTDCTPVFKANPCLAFLPLPTTDVEAECDALGEPKITQFADNGYCITGPLALPLEAQEATYTAAASGDMLFGWDDINTGATLKDDGAYSLPPAIFIDPPEPNGLRVVAILQVALQCTMGVDSGGPPEEGGVAVCVGGANDGQSCLTPSDSSNDFCVGGDNAGDNCDPGTAGTAEDDCPDGICENADCGADASCSPSDQASPSPDSALLSIPIVE